MSHLSAIRSLGVELVLAPNNKVRLVGLDKLPSKNVTKAIQLVQQRKAGVVAELQAEAAQFDSDNFIHHVYENNDSSGDQWPDKQQHFYNTSIDSVILNSDECVEIRNWPVETREFS